MVFLTTGTLHKPVLPVDLVMKVESALRAAGVESSLSRQAQGEGAASRIAAFTSSGRAAAV